MSADAQQIAEALEDDPFHIDSSVAGSLNAELLDQARQTTQGLDFEVFVIAVDEDSLDADLLEQIKVLHGGDGAFIMINGDSEIAVDVRFESDHDQYVQVTDQLSIARESWNVSTPSVTKLNTLLDLYAHPQARTEAESSTGQEAPGSEVATVDGSNSFPTLFLGGAILVLALVIGAVWLTRSRRQRAAALRTRRQFELPARLLDRVDTLQRTSLRESISSETTELAARIESLQTQNLGPDDAGRVERSLDAYAIARRIVDDEDSERIDLAGAMVLLREAGREIAEVSLHRRSRRGTRAAESSRSTGALPQSLCTVNPLHGEATSLQQVITSAAESGKRRSVRVPVCADCRDDLADGRTLQWIYDGDRPYVDVDSVWSQTLFGAIGRDLVTALHKNADDPS
ncbi:hypothetical protein [Brevibacterium atlanticum]|uniref:hypothetical protein n=1 Tax=Brevibacterium atlanticum TaxID=2697563 RepID=UPI00141DE543|nr:hypothetical protein [Brevibacterium atlanticum]